MQQEEYLYWATKNTETTWWHDSAEPHELKLGIERGAIGATTNPYLTNLALINNKKDWEHEIREIFALDLEPEKRTEFLMGIPVKHAVHQLLPIYEKTRGKMGYVCAQVNPSRAGEREKMFSMAKDISSWAPNITVKLPADSAGLDVLEECIAIGIPATATVSFTVPQVIAVAERHRKGIERAKKNKIKPGNCFAVIMIGRLDDFLREVALDNHANISEDDIRMSGIAVTKRAYSIFRERKYETVLLIAALRGTYHMTEIAGAKLTISIAPNYQKIFMSKDFPHEERIDKKIPADVIERLMTLPDFVRAYEPDGMEPKDFISFGSTQRTLTQFVEAGWKLMENFKQ
ncbi:MAG: hypothetical protein JW787_09345 [Sedimentisphaerales bacterium]|nr:hypothetical protein [Sedimentisphaerales bacterium]